MDPNKLRYRCSFDVINVLNTFYVGFEVTDEELEIAAEFMNAATTKLQPSQRQPAIRIGTNTDKGKNRHYTPLLCGRDINLIRLCMIKVNHA